MITFERLFDEAKNGKNRPSNEHRVSPHVSPRESPITKLFKYSTLIDQFKCLCTPSTKNGLPKGRPFFYASRKVLPAHRAVNVHSSRFSPTVNAKA